MWEKPLYLAGDTFQWQTVESHLESAHPTTTTTAGWEKKKLKFSCKNINGHGPPHHCRMGEVKRKIKIFLQGYQWSWSW